MQAFAAAFASPQQPTSQHDAAAHAAHQQAQWAHYHAQQQAAAAQQQHHPGHPQQPPHAGHPDQQRMPPPQQYQQRAAPSAVAQHQVAGPPEQFDTGAAVVKTEQPATPDMPQCAPSTSQPAPAPQRARPAAPTPHHQQQHQWAAHQQQQRRMQQRRPIDQAPTFPPGCVETAQPRKRRKIMARDVGKIDAWRLVSRLIYKRFMHFRNFSIFRKKIRDS